MARRLLGMVALGTTIIALSACDGRSPFGGSINNGTTPARAEVDIGNPLYESMAAPPAAKMATTGTQADPIVIQGAQITIPKTENVPSKNNGTLWQICTELTPGQLNPEDVFEHPTEPGKRFRRLKEGEFVAKGQLVALLDDRQARAKYNAAVTDKIAADKSLEGALREMNATENTFNAYKSLQVVGAGAKVELNRAEQEFAAAFKRHADAVGAKEKSIEAEKISKVILEEHELRASIDGRIKTIYRKPGESVKELEPVLLIEHLNTLRVEGGVPIQYMPYLTNPVGKKVWLEPAAQLGPFQEMIGHWSAITGVAVSKDARKPSIVTVSEDKTLRVWDQKSRSQQAMYSLDTPIRAVACTGPKSQLNLALFGADDGFGYLYNLDATGADAVKKLKTKHKGRIVTVAFSPDGQNCATADDKEIIIWDTEKLEPRYRFMAEHRGPITSIQFTPQTKLVSVARDRTVRVWDLGDKAAKLNTILDNRSGTVDVLGVSPDGQRILFDQERALHVRNLADQRTEAILNAPTDSTQFTGFAAFSHDGQLAITAGTADNPLGVWKLPAPGSNRAYQRVRLSAGGSTPTCAAVAPEGGFVVVGTQDHRVMVFARPEKTDLEKQYEAKITLLDQALDSTDRKMRIWAELPNPGLPLIPGDTITIVVPIQ